MAPPVILMKHATAKRRDKIGRLVKAMYCTSDAPQNWSDEVRREMSRLGDRASVLHPFVLVVVQVGVCFCVGP